MDAAEAVLRDDFRRAILYSAIAAEAISKLRIDELAKEAAASKQEDGRFRMREVAGERRDPVLARLRRNSRFIN